MEEYLDRHIRISTRTKFRLDEVKKDMSYNAYISEMLDYFEVTCTSPKLKIKNPTARLEKRIENLIKIVKCQEKDIFRPLLDNSFSSGNMSMNNDQLVRLANENKSLKEELQRYKESGESPDVYKRKLDSLINLINLFCDKSQFRKATFGNDLLVPESYFEKFLDKIKSDYVL